MLRSHCEKQQKNFNCILILHFTDECAYNYCRFQVSHQYLQKHAEMSIQAENGFISSGDRKTNYANGNDKI